MSDLARSFEDVSLRPFHWRIGLASTGGVFADGFGLGIIGISLTLASRQLGLTPVGIGLVGGASLAGLFAGALLTGPAADHFGRRPIFAYNMLVAAGLSLLQFAAASGSELVWLRLLIGFVLGTDYVVSKALLTEFAPRQLRGRILGLLSIAWAGGYAAAYSVGFVLMSLGPQSWRWMLAASALPCLLIAPLRLTMPESPLWLARHGQAERATRIIHGCLGPDILPMPPTQLAAPQPCDRRAAWGLLFGPRWRVHTLVACTFFTCQVIPYFAVGTFVSQVMTELSLQGGSSGGLLYNMSLLLGAVAGFLMVDRVSRRGFLIGSFTTAAIAMLTLIAWPNVPPGPMIVLFATFAGVLSAASNLVYVYLPELFPTTARASGIGLAIATSRIGSAASTFLLPIVVADYGVRSALGACVAVLVIGAVVCQRWAPETRNLSLEALDQTAGEAR